MEGLYLVSYEVNEIGVYKKSTIYTFTEDDILSAVEQYQKALKTEEPVAQAASVKTYVTNKGLLGRLLTKNVEPPETEAEKLAEFQRLLQNKICVDEDGTVKDAVTLDQISDEQMVKVIQEVVQSLPSGQSENTFTPDPTYEIPANPIDTITFEYAGQEIEVNAKDVTYTNKIPTTKLVFTKTDVSTGEALPNTEIRFFNSDKEQIYAGKTDAEGKIEIERLPAGIYYFQEINPPAGYMIDDGLYKFVITNDDIKNQKVIQCQMTNKMQRGILSLQKKGESYKIKDKKEFQYEETNSLAGAVFNILAEQDIKLPSGKVLVKKGTIVDTLTTDEDGKADTKELYLGKYRIKEVKAPEGYVLAEDVLVTLSAENQKIELTNKDVTIKNRLIKGKVIISKTDVSNGKPLPDTGIRILDNEKKEILKGRTDKNGKLTFDKLPAGTYYFQEFDAPKGYKISDKYYKFVIKKDGDIVKCTMTNKGVEITHAVQTSDDRDIIGLLVLALAAGAAVMASLIHRRKKRDSDTEDN